MSTRATILLVALLPIALTACGGDTDAAKVPGAPATGEKSPSPPLPPLAPDRIVGIYHLAQVDATNLQLSADGTYTWSIEGCDYGGGQCGYWSRTSAGEVMLQSGDAALVWSAEGSFRQKMRWLKVTPTESGVRVQGETDGSGFIDQPWTKGRSCAICGGNLGPTGQEACNAPLPDVCVKSK